MARSGSDDPDLEEAARYRRAAEEPLDHVPIAHRLPAVATARPASHRRSRIAASSGGRCAAATAETTTASGFVARVAQARSGPGRDVRRPRSAGIGGFNRGRRSRARGGRRHASRRIVSGPIPRDHGAPSRRRGAPAWRRSRRARSRRHRRLESESSDASALKTAWASIALRRKRAIGSSGRATSRYQLRSSAPHGVEDSRLCNFRTVVVTRITATPRTVWNGRGTLAAALGTSRRCAAFARAL